MDLDINGLIRIQSWIEPPSFVYGEFERAGHHGTEKALEWTGKEWDGIVSQLEQDGYSDLLRFMDRLACHVKEWTVARDSHLARSLRPSVLYVRSLDSLVAAHGEGATLYEAIGPSDCIPRPPDTGALWYGDTKGDLTGHGPDREDPNACSFRLEISRSLLTEWGIGPKESVSPRLRRSFDGAETLGSARAEAFAIHEMEREEADLRSRRVELARFKLKLVEAILREYEVLGFVSPFSKRQQAQLARPKLYDTDDLEARGYLAMIWVVHDEDEFGMEDSRYKLYAAAAERLGLESHKFYTVLTRARAHLRTGSGRYGNEDGFRHLLRCAEDAWKIKNACSD